MSNKTYQKEYAERLAIAEKRTVPKITRYYFDEYKKGINNFVSNGRTDYISLFSYGVMQNIYSSMYEEIGMYFAKWYYNNYEKFLTKNKKNIKKHIPLWEALFADYAKRVAATNVVGVTGTSKKTLVAITQRLMRDAEFNMLGADAKTRILQSQFKKYSRNQAMRLVRTESNRIANYATEQSALSLFGKDNLQKTWIHSLGANERPTHLALHLTSVDFDEPFMVGGEAMQRPGEGSAANVINCRCSVNYEPKPVENFDLLIGIGAAYVTSQLIEQD